MWTPLLGMCIICIVLCTHTDIFVFAFDGQKAQYKRRVRDFNTKLAECKQERAMENFDHKNAIAKLTEEKAALSGDGW